MAKEIWALVPGESNPVRVVMPGMNIGTAYCWAVELPNGEVRLFRDDVCTECTAEGVEVPPTT